MGSTTQYQSPFDANSVFNQGLIASNRYNTNIGSQQTNMLAKQDSAFYEPENLGVDLGESFDFGLNAGTLKLGTAAFGAYNGWQSNKAAQERNDIARAELGQNAKSFDINAGMQLATLQQEEARKNNYAGGFLSEDQRSNRFQDYQLDKLGSYNVK